MKHPYSCPACDGSGHATCYACDQEIECERCDGDGLDATKMDVRAYRKAHYPLIGQKGYRRWIIDGVEVGGRSDTTGVSFRQFDRDPARREQAPKLPYHDPAQATLFAQGPPT